MGSSREYLSFFSEQKDLMTSLLIEWANVNSGSDNIEGLNDMRVLLKRAFASLKGVCTEIEVPPRILINSLGNPESKNQGKALHIKKHPQAHFQVLLGGHMDTVFSSECPFQKIQWLDANNLRGPGVTDMKGGLVVLLKALECLENSPLAGKIGWEVLITADEETGSQGSGHLWVECAKRNRLGLLFEPALSDGSLVNSRKGSANHTLVCRGKSAHAGRDFHSGKNAITALCRVIPKLEALSSMKEGITVNIGAFHGGGVVNIVPDLAICQFNVRTTKEHQLEDLSKQIQAMVEEADKETPMTLFSSPSRPPKLFNELQVEIFKKMFECAKDLGIPLEGKPSGGVCDGNILAQNGLPVIDSLGVVGGNIHTYEEFIRIDSLIERAQLAAYFLMTLAEENS